MACNCPTIKSIPESDKRKRSRTIPRIDANLILNLSSLITTENESSREFLMVVNEIVTSNVKVYILFLKNLVLGHLSPSSHTQYPRLLFNVIFANVCGISVGMFCSP
ncbi:uncharacterized protein isoform X7 [Rhodnius prolixus]|uniref:uncharacterized protein isoform X7 n=1 Tax=Rhodnius prolixus TaxID=13249 RepID=UPI003D18F4DB